MIAVIGVAGHEKAEATLEAAGLIGEFPGIDLPRIPAVGDEGMVQDLLVDEIDDIKSLLVARFAVVDDGNNTPLRYGIFSLQIVIADKGVAEDCEIQAPLFKSDRFIEELYVPLKLRRRLLHARFRCLTSIDRDEDRTQNYKDYTEGEQGAYRGYDFEMPRHGPYGLHLPATCQWVLCC